MSLGQTVKKAAVQSAISTTMLAIGHRGTFKRVVAEVNRANEQMPHHTGKEKRNRVMADLEIIFDDLVVPFATFFLHFLIEAALVYLYGRVTDANDG